MVFTFLDNKIFTVFVTLDGTYKPAKYTWTVGEKSFPESDDNFLNLPRQEYEGTKRIEQRRIRNGNSNEAS
jgi:hypothetical protein